VCNNHKKPKQMVILCGGLGTRIEKFTSKTPKPLLLFKSRPFLYYLITYFAKKGIRDFLLFTHYKSNLFIKFSKQYDFKNLNIEIVNEKTKLGTGGGILNFKKKLHNSFFLLNGDTLRDIDINKFIKIHNKYNKCITVALSENTSHPKLGRLNIKKSRLIKDPRSKFINSGLYLIDKKIFNISNYKKKKLNSKISFENEILDDLIINNKASGYKNKNDKFIDIGSYKSLIKMNKDNFYTKKNRAIFLDRDGVLNVDYGYVYKIKDLKFENKIVKILNYYKKNNFLFILVSNQSGVGRKFYKLIDVLNFNNEMRKRLLTKEIDIIDYFICPHTPLVNCKCRKPSPKMINDASLLWNIDKNKSFMIGDKISDYESAKRANVKFIYKKKIEKLF